jgi:hypothetical protein
MARNSGEDYYILTPPCQKPGSISISGSLFKSNSIDGKFLSAADLKESILHEVPLITEGKLA